jgi:hypothetical protein
VGVAAEPVHAGYRLRLIDVLVESGYCCAATGRYADAVTLWSARDALQEGII